MDSFKSSGIFYITLSRELETTQLAWQKKNEELFSDADLQSILSSANWQKEMPPYCTGTPREKLIVWLQNGTNLNALITGSETLLDYSKRALMSNGFRKHERFVFHEEITHELQKIFIKENNILEKGKKIGHTWKFSRQD